MRRYKKILLCMLLGIVVIFCTACDVNQEIDDFSEAAIEEILAEVTAEAAIENGATEDKATPTTKVTNANPTPRSTETTEPTPKPTKPVATSTPKPTKPVATYTPTPENNLPPRPDLSVYGKITFKRWFNTPVPGTCPDTYLFTGDHVVVTFDAIEYGIRSVPYMDDDKIIGYANSGSVGRITDGPYCDERIILWEISFRDGRSGWFAEGDETNRGLVSLDGYERVINAFGGDFEKMQVYEMIVTTLFSFNVPDSEKGFILNDLRKTFSSNTFNPAIGLLPIYTEKNEYEPTTLDDLLGGAISNGKMIPNDSDFKIHYPGVLIPLVNYDTTGEELQHILGWD